MKRDGEPPFLLDGARIVQYATVPQRPNGRTGVVVNGVGLDPQSVSHIAIVQMLLDETYFVLHCNERWETVAAEPFSELAVAEAAIGAEIHQALDVDRHLAPEVALDKVVPIDRLANLHHFCVGELGHATLSWNVHLLADFLSLLRTDAVNILKRDDDALVGRNVNAGYTSHSFMLHLGDAYAGSKASRD